MKYLLICAVSFAFATTAIVKCNTISGTVPAFVLPYNLESPSKIHLTGPIPLLLPKLLRSTEPDEAPPAILPVTSSPLFETPNIESLSNEKSDTSEAVPIIEPILEPTEEFVSYPHQPEPVLTAKEIEDLKAIRKIANQIGECKPESLTKCDVFKMAGGIVCSNTSAGVVCDNLDLTPCAELVIDACYDFTDTAGVFCSEGGCAQYNTE